MPKAFGQKFMYLDHDSDVVNEAPPVLNQWYTAFDALDVRLIWCRARQTNVETAAKDINVRWTIDGNVYFVNTTMDNNTWYYVFRYPNASTGGTLGLATGTPIENAGYHVDKRGQSFKVEVRIVSALGTNQTLECECVRETLELT